MIFICVKWKVKPEYAEQWIELTRDFTEATRAEPGNIFFQWSRSVDDTCEYVLVEAFRDGDAGAAHVGSDHFKQAQKTLPPYLAAVPKIVNVTLPQDDWSRLAEFAGSD